MIITSEGLAIVTSDRQMSRRCRISCTTILDKDFIR